MQQNATNQEGCKITPKQERAIFALLSEPNMEQAATTAKVNKATLWRWLQDKDFHAAYMAARRESVKQAIANLQQSSSEAVKVLCEVMSDRQVNPFARVGAAKAIIEYSLKAVEVEDLAQRVGDLEAAFNAKPR